MDGNKPITDRDNNHQLNELREQLHLIRKAHPSFQQMLSDLKTLERAASELKERMYALYPDDVPRCHYCKAIWYDGHHSACCGAL